MADFEDSGPSDPVPGASRSLADVTVLEAMSMPPSPARPDWMVTRFPVSMQEFRELTDAAAQPGAPGEEAQSDVEIEVDTTESEFPEDGSAAGPEADAPVTSASFDGIPQTAWMPPDNTIGVGPSNVLAAVNADLAGYSRAGAQQFRWANMTTLFSPVMPPNASLFDPRVAYDHYANRWIVVVAARRQNPPGSWIMVGVSQGTDPAGPYWIWALDSALDGATLTNNWADFPMLGFDTRGIYLGLSMFAIGGGFQYAKIRILNKAELYAGGTGTSHLMRWYDFWGLRNPDGSLAFTVQPAVHFRRRGGNPSAFLVNALWPSGASLTLWTLSSPLAFWTGGTPGLAATAVACRSYDLPPDAIQQGTDVRIETNDSRLLNAVFQYAGGVRRLWTCQTSRHTWPGESEARSAVQWYEIDVPTASVVQQNRYGVAGSYYYFPAIHTDASRNAHLVFGRSGASEFAQLRQTGRRVNDAQGSLQGSALIQAGQGIYTRGRWGDYFGICRDPADTSQVWMYGEYAGTGDTWATRVAAARF